MMSPHAGRSFGRVARGASVERHAGTGEEAGLQGWSLRCDATASGQRCPGADRRGLAGYPLTDRRQFDILLCGPARRGELYAIRSQPARVHRAARQRGCMAARGACAAAYQSAAGRYLVSRCQRDCGDADCLREEIRHLGYVEQEPIPLDFRLSNGIMAARRGVGTHPVNVIVTDTTSATLAAFDATRTIPIVMGATGGDPVALGLAKSFSRPGGNVTGTQFLTGLSDRISAVANNLLSLIAPWA